MSRGKVVRALAASGGRAPSLPPARARSPIAEGTGVRGSDAGAAQMRLA